MSPHPPVRVWWAPRREHAEAHGARPHDIVIHTENELYDYRDRDLFIVGPAPVRVYRYATAAGLNVIQHHRWCDIARCPASTRKKPA